MSYFLTQNKETGELTVTVNEFTQYRNVTLSSFLRIRRLRFFAKHHYTGREGSKWVITFIRM